MSAWYAHKRSSTFECMDSNPEAADGSVGDQNGALFYHVGGRACLVRLTYKDRKLLVQCAPNKDIILYVMYILSYQV